VKHITITRTPEYHYVGDLKCARVLKDFFHLKHSKYTPIGFHKSINVNAVHIATKEAVT